MKQPIEKKNHKKNRNDSTRTHIPNMSWRARWYDQGSSLIQQIYTGALFESVRHPQGYSGQPENQQVTKRVHTFEKTYQSISCKLQNIAAYEKKQAYGISKLKLQNGREKKVDPSNILTRGKI
jgi:hypothetical protein